MTEPTSTQRLEELGRRSSNAADVESIANAGHAASTAVSAVMIGSGVLSAGSVSGAVCFAAPLAVGAAGAFAGAALGSLAGEKLLDLVGAPKIAQRGPQPATVGHQIAHTNAFAGAIGGLLAGVAVGALVAVTLSTGGLAAPLLIAAAAGLAGGFAGSLVNSFLSGMASVTGTIITGSPNVFFEGKPVARVTDQVSCSKHPGPPPQIAEGSDTIGINGLPLARIGHKTTCGAAIQQGCSTITADMTTGQYGPIDADMTVLEQTIVSLTEVALCLSAVKLRNSRTGRLIFGEPVDPSDGAYVNCQTDFTYESVLPLELKRSYEGKDTIEGHLGSRWICNWSQTITYDLGKKTAILEDGDGEVLQFSLGSSRRFNARNLKAPHYHLTGTPDRAFLFDLRTRRRFIFTPDTRPGRAILTAIEDNNGNRIDFTYTAGRLSGVTHTDGIAFTVRTTPEGYIESVGRGNETVVSYRYEEGRLIDAYGLFTGEIHYRYTTEGRLCHWHDSGVTSLDIVYDAKGRVTATTTPDGMYNDHFIYDGTATVYVDAEGARTKVAFTKDGFPLREEDPLGNVTEHTWDVFGKKLSTTDPLNRTTVFGYNGSGQLVEETDFAGLSTRYTYDENGLLTRIDYPDGTCVSGTYDERDNLLESTGRDGITFTFSHDDKGRILSETGPDGTIRYEYDRYGHLVSERDPLGATTLFRFDTWDRLSSLTDALGNTTIYEHGRHLDRILRPDGGEERFTYDAEGCITSHTEAEGQLTRYTHGAFDLLRSVTDPAGYTTRYDYDRAARLTRITNAMGQTWDYTLDGAGRCARETDFAGRATQYTRDAAGRVIEKHLPDNTAQTLTWDDYDRIVSVDAPDVRITYAYDSADRLTRASTERGGDEESDLAFTYDDRGRLVNEVQNGIPVTYTYDRSGRLNGMTTPSGTSTFAYDFNGLPKKVSSNGHDLDFTRNVLGLETERSYSSFDITRSYDPSGRLTELTAGRKGPHALPLITRRFTWDRSGRLTGIKDGRTDRHYTYDPRDQVSRVTRPRGEEEHYRYDALLNLAGTNGRPHTYNAGEVQSTPAASYRYDARGRVIEKTMTSNGFRPKTWHYTWDSLDCLIRVTTPDNKTWHYLYDAFGRRIKKECKETSRGTTYIWQGAKIVEEHRSRARTTEIYRWHYEPGTFTPVAVETDDNFYPIVTDHLGTPKEIFDKDGECVWQADHTLWGRIRILHEEKVHRTHHVPLITCPIRFPNGNVKYFVSAPKNIVHPIAYVLIQEDCIEDPLHAGPVLEDPHGPRPPADFPEDPFYGVGRPHLPSEGCVTKGKKCEQVIEIIP